MGEHRPARRYPESNGSLIKTWKALFDRDKSGKVVWGYFEEACKTIGFTGRADKAPAGRSSRPVRTG